jgi:V/A-type H+-transporting ATPase subunit I
MKKVSLVILDKNREDSLDKLREAGVVHLERRGGNSETLTKLLETRARSENALGLLRSFQLDKKAPKVPITQGGAELTAQALSLGDEKKTLQEQLVFAAKERTRIEKWGNFDPAAFRDLAASGITLTPYEIPVKAYDTLDTDTRVIFLSRDTVSARFVTLDGELPGETPFALPERSLAELDAVSAATGKRLAEIDAQLLALAAQKGAIEAELKLLLARIEFETAKADVQTPEDIPEEFAISYITGFVPQEDVGVLKRVSAENGWALMADDPGPDDQVPTKLKNNKLASLIYPLTDFLEVVPGYNEVDISGWFLLFFCIFFGMIFGDAGYGALLLIAAIAGMIRTAKKGVPPMLKLLLLLGLSNFTWGLLTCTWFGVEVDKLPQILRDISLPLISNVTSAASEEGSSLVQQNLMIFCFSLALLQLSIGHIISIIRGRTLKVLGDLGSIAMLVGMYFIVLSLIASNEYRRIPMMMPMVYLFGAGFVLNFMFASYEGSLGRSILESVKNIISMILGIANVFSDIMSYIRLWAVGLAGGAIASTVDTMAGPMLGHFIFFIFGIVLLVFGHGLNLILNVLSVLVHGVRLNTLEFSGHAGLTWSGFAYKPFAKRNLPTNP